MGVIDYYCTTMVSSIIALVLLQVLLVVGANAIPLAQFYPYGSGTGDTSIFRNDDGSSLAINLTTSFPFFNRDHATLFVNNNGIISFTVAVMTFTPDPFPLSGGLELIAPFWADVDTRGTGDVWFRETASEQLLDRALEEIRAAFAVPQNFRPCYLIIATWDHVGYYDQKTDKTNTFQCIMATDGFSSFVIYYYADGEIQWTTGDDQNGENGLGGTPAQVGFNAGDGIRFATVPGSRTSEIINITQTSNVDIPGVWIFQVDEVIKPAVVCDPPCENGTCIGNNTCNCAAGFLGERCNETAVIAECVVSPCENGGTCQIRAGSFSCICPLEYTGLLCENTSGSQGLSTASVTIVAVVLSAVAVIIGGV